MKVAFLTRYDRARGSSRLRAFDLVEPLARCGIEARVLPRNGRGPYWPRALGLAAWADVVVLQKPNQSPGLVDLLSTVNRRLAVDLDDALWCPTAADPTRGEVAAARRAESRLVHVLRRARAGFVGSGWLADRVRARRPGLEVVVLPTSVDLERYGAGEPDRRPRPAAKPILGWIGSGDNLGELERIGPVLARLRSRCDFTLRVISSGPPSLPTEVEVDFREWSAESEVETLRGCDLGLMPLDDTERARGRCGFKAIQYMATGLPVVASAVGAAPEVVEDGVTGFLARSPEEWLDRLERLAADPGLREAMGRAGRLRAERRFSIQSNLPRLVAGLERVAGGANGASR